MAKEIFHRLVAPAATIAAVLFFCQPLYHRAGGNVDYIVMFLLVGIPFGIQKMFVWFIPKGHDIGGTIGMIVFNVLVGGIIGIFVLAWKILTGLGFLVLYITKKLNKITQQKEA